MATTTADWAISLSHAKSEDFSSYNHHLVTIPSFVAQPQVVQDFASLQNFANITPHYPGLRAPLDPAVTAAWAERLSPLLSAHFGPANGRWAMQAWCSIVTTAPRNLAPLQRFPHVDGTDPAQIAMMLYLHESPHGGTAFYRHRSSGLSALTEATFPVYRSALEADVARTGLPVPAYPTDGAPHFERLHATSGAFNSAVFYRGNILHSGVIDNAAPLPADPRTGRLTINAFFRPL
ncbi:MAG: DUF6445 family protein [Erythrobacter sp.]